MDKLKFENHIASVFDEELEEIRNDLMAMGGQVEQQLTDAVQAICEADSQLAEQVIQRDHRVDEMELEIDEACVLVIARRQPAASGRSAGRQLAVRRPSPGRQQPSAGRKPAVS